MKGQPLASRRAVLHPGVLRGERFFSWLNLRKCLFLAQTRGNYFQCAFKEPACGCVEHERSSSCCCCASGHVCLRSAKSQVAPASSAAPRSQSEPLAFPRLSLKCSGGFKHLQGARRARWTLPKQRRLDCSALLHPHTEMQHHLAWLVCPHCEGTSQRLGMQSLFALP